MIPTASTFRRPNKVLLLSPINTQRLPDTAASTLLRLLKPRLLSSREHLGGVTQISPRRDVDMWGVFEWAVLGGVVEIFFDKEYLFGFETLVFATSGILSMQRESKTWNRIMWPL